MGCCGEDRRAAALPSTRPTVSLEDTSTTKCSYMRRVATTIRTKTCRHCKMRCKAIFDLGYSVVKMKIGGAPLSEDLRRIEAVLKILKTSDQRMQAAYRREVPAHTRRHSPD